MTNRFEQLIEYVINDEEQKARELFHQIVVEKSREIYESLMQEDDDMGRMDRYDEALGGDQSEDLIDDIESDETGLSEADDEDAADEEGAEEMDLEIDGTGSDEVEDSDQPASQADVDEIKDMVIDLGADIEQLMAEFLNSENKDNMDMDTMDTEEEVSEMMPMTNRMRGTMEEAVSLKAAPKPVTSEEGGINKSSTVAANSGGRGAMAHPVKMTGDTAQGRPAPSTKDLIGKVGNTPAQSGSPKLEAAPKPHLAQATGVNTKTPFPKS